MRMARVGSLRSTPTSPRSTRPEKPIIRPAWARFIRRRERPTRGKRTKSSAVKTKMGMERRQVTARKERPTTRRERRMRGTSTGRPVRFARALAVVALDLAAQVAQHQRARRHHQDPQEAQAVAQAAPEHGAGDEVEQREDDDLLVVRGALAGGQADDLEGGGELDEDVEHRHVHEHPRHLHGQHQEEGAGVEVAERRVPLPGLAYRERADEPDQDDRAHRAGELPGEDQRQHAERRQRVGHDPVDEAEPHARPRALALAGAPPS